MNLKTLENLDEVWVNSWKEKHYDKFGEKVIEEREIKIIDDIPSRFVKFDELKSEAIKDIKFLRLWKSQGGIKLLPWITTTDFENTGLNAIVEYIKWKNNLTDEDLMTNEEKNAREHGERGNN